MKLRKCWLLILGVMLMGWLFGCGKPDDAGSQNGSLPEITVHVDNQAEEADIWILPQTPETLKTTLWGTATVRKLAAGDRQDVRLTQTPGADAWLVRIIDKDHRYYAAQDLTLEEGYTLLFTEEESNSNAQLQVLDRNGTVLTAQNVFVGALGGG